MQAVPLIDAMDRSMANDGQHIGHASYALVRVVSAGRLSWPVYWEVGWSRLLSDIFVRLAQLSSAQLRLVYTQLSYITLDSD